jgi:hypothetical protein
MIAAGILLRGGVVQLMCSVEQLDDDTFIAGEPCTPHDTSTWYKHLVDAPVAHGAYFSLGVGWGRGTLDAHKI